MRVKVTLFEGVAIVIVAAAHFHSFGASCIGLVVNVPGGAVRGRGGVPGCAGAAAVSCARPLPAHVARCIRAAAGCLCIANSAHAATHHFNYFLHLTRHVTAIPTLSPRAKSRDVHSGRDSAIVH